MRFGCSASKLIEGLQIVTKALAQRTTNPILEGVLIETDSNQIILTCSDERITIVTRIEARIEEAGRGVAPGKLFNEIIQDHRAENITGHGEAEGTARKLLKLPGFRHAETLVAGDFDEMAEFFKRHLG